ncbi:MAG: hypothetical protein AAF840_16790, partial [Bacteroidota bacterium]
MAKVGFKRLAIHHANGALIVPNHFVSGVVDSFYLSGRGFYLKLYKHLLHHPYKCWLSALRKVQTITEITRLVSG